ncbi:unnamed protein product [Urochloa humidicola]
MARGSRGPAAAEQEHSIPLPSPCSPPSFGKYKCSFHLLCKASLDGGCVSLGVVLRWYCTVRVASLGVILHIAMASKNEAWNPVMDVSGE